MGNVEEIIWASMVLNIPGFAQLVASKLTWETFWCKSSSCRDTRHSPTNLDDMLMDTYYIDFRTKMQDLFFIRTITPSRSENLLTWLDARIAWEQWYYASPNFTGFPPSPPSHPPGRRSPGSLKLLDLIKKKAPSRP